MCNDTELQNGTENQNTAYAVVFGSVMTLGLPLNAVALWIFLRRHSLRYTNAVFMVNLAISDLLLVVSLPMRVYFYATGNWPLNDMWCIWITMLFNNNIRSSSIFITFICVDRLLAVVHPLRSRHLRTPSNAWKAAALVWLFVVVVNVPESVKFSRCFNNQSLDRYICNKSICFEFLDHVSQVDYLQPVLVFTLLAVNVVCTTMVSWTLHRHRKDSAKVNNKVNVMLIFVMNLVMFTVFFLPVSLTIFWDRPVTSMKCLASVNCCLDPLLYYFSFDGFWKRKEDVDTSLAE